MIGLLYGANIYVPKLDKKWYEGFNEIKNKLKILFPDKIKNCEVIGEIQNNSTETDLKQKQDKNALSLFSGGIDAFLVYEENKENLRRCVFIEGFDHPVGSPILADLKSFLKKWFKGKYEITFIKFNQHSFFNHKALSKRFDFLGSDGYFGNIQFGMTSVCLVIPIADLNNCNKILYGSSSKESTYNIKISGLRGDLPFIINRIQWSKGGTKVEHSDFSKQEKIAYKLRRFDNFNNNGFPFKVCFTTRDKWNCGKCEKCIRTILGLVSVGLNPQKYGFTNYCPNDLQKFRNIIKSNNIIKIYNLNEWNDIKNSWKNNENKNLQTKRFKKWIIKFDFEKAMIDAKNRAKRQEAFREFVTYKIKRPLSKFVKQPVLKLFR